MSPHVRLGNLESRRASAKARQLEYNKLTIAERIARLDKKYGKGLGAVKERTRLIKKSEMPKEVPKVEVKKKETPSQKEKFKKKYNKDVGKEKKRNWQRTRRGVKSKPN